MHSFMENLKSFVECMQAEGLTETVIKSFEYYYCQLASGETGVIPETSIRPVSYLPDVEAFPPALSKLGHDAQNRTVIIKLNGGLGTSMGLDRAKSLLSVKNNFSFLDIVVRQARQKSFPLVLMNSFMTHDDTLNALPLYSELQSGAPLVFQQHKIPKVNAADLGPVNWPQDRRLEWCPPGHGDLYLALETSGLLNRLLDTGFEYAFVSNIDNLGATIDTLILGYFVDNQLPFLMEAADRTEADKKGGHLARHPEGQLMLREVAQCPSDDLPSFQDTTQHKYFNTNNIWLDLRAVKKLVKATDGILKLPMIRNLKPVDSRNSSSPLVYQLESAMGAAIELFEGAAAVRVRRTRFAPVKTTEDLIRIRSDLYCMTDDFHVIQNPARRLGHLSMNLDTTLYGTLDSIEEYFPCGVPSLLECSHLEIRGKVRFGRNVTLRGNVRFLNESETPIDIKDGAIIEGK